jgi:translocation and assembly module TamB
MNRSRFARRLLVPTLAALAGAGALVAAALVYLSSPPCERRLLGELLGRVNAAIQGRLAVADLDLHPDGTLELGSASLFDPEGKLVARAERIRARVDLLPLLAKRIHAASIALQGGALSLENQQEGVNVARALARRHWLPPGASGPLDWTFIADRIDIEELAFSYRLSPSAPPLVALDKASLSARGRFGARSELSASASGELQSPIAGPFHLEVACAGGSSSGPFEPLAIQTVALEAPGTRARVSGRLAGAHLKAELTQLAVPRALLDALAPGHPLVSDVTAEGAFAVGAQALEVDARLGAGGGRVEVRGRAGFSPLNVQVAARVDEVDLHRLFAGMPATDLHANLDGTLAGLSPRRGHLEVLLDPSTVRGVKISSAGASVDLEGARATVRSLLAELPGGRVGLWGRARREALDLMASLDLQSAAQFSRALGALFGVEPLDVEGRGVLSARLLGPPASPRLAFAGQLASVRLGAIEVKGLSLEGALPNAARPLAFRATVAAKEGRVGELPFANLDASVQADRRAFSADLTTAGLSGVKAHLSGVLDADRRGGRVDLLELVADRARWVATAPTRVDLREGFRVDRLTLRSGEQRLTLAGGVAGGALALALEARKLDLAALPKLVLPAALVSRGLSGLLDLDATVRGSAQRPEGSAHLRGARLGVGRLHDLEAEVAVALDRDRLSGKATLGRARGKGELAVDLPRALLEAPPGSPVAAHGSLRDLDLGELAPLLAPKLPLAGTADLSFELSGTVDRPDARAKLSGRRITWAKLPAAEVELQLDSNASSQGLLSASLPGGPLRAELALGLGLRALLHAPMTQALLAAPARGTLSLRGIGLEPFAGALLPEGLAGAASLDGRVEGTLGAPLGEVHLSIERGVAGRFTDLGLKADLLARAGELSLSSGLRWRGASAASLTARLARSPSQLTDRAALAKAPVEAHLSVGPIELARALGIDKALFEGSATLGAALRGTLGQPLLEASAGTALSANGQGLGRLESRGRYRGGKATLEATVLSSTGGSAALEGEVGLELGLGALLAGVDWAAAPLDARLRTKNLDLQALSLAAPAREVRGTLTVSGEVKGTLGAPRPRGTLSLRDGQIAIPGFGTWRQVALDLSGTDRLLELAKLSARAGNGSLEAQASAERASLEEPYQLEGHLEAHNLPLTVNDRLIAFLTGSTDRLSGQVQGRTLALDARLARTEVQLPEVIGGRELQPLEGHPDVFVRTGSGPTARQLAAAAEPPSPREGGFLMRVHLLAPDNVSVLSSDLKVEAGADLLGTFVPGHVELKGEADLRSGRADALGRRFDVQRSKLAWSADRPANPRLDLHGTYDNVREQVKVKVTVSGTGQKPKIELSSEPPLDEAEIATLLATGRRELKRGTGGVSSGGGAASVAGNFLASRLRRVLSSKVPLDVLQVEVGSDPRAQQTRLEAGTYVGDRVYLGYRRSFGADTEHHQNANEVRVEYQITPRISLESEYGDQGSGGANVVFSRDY